MLQQLECATDSGCGSWQYPQGILNEICQFTLRWYRPRDLNQIVMDRGGLYLFAFHRDHGAANNVSNVMQSVKFTVNAMEDGTDGRWVTAVDVFNWGLQHGDSVCINESASCKEWKGDDLIHVEVDMRCGDGDGNKTRNDKMRMEFWITSNGVCSRGICIEIESPRRPLRLLVDGGFAFKMGVQLC